MKGKLAAMHSKLFNKPQQEENDSSVSLFPISVSDVLFNIAIDSVRESC